MVRLTKIVETYEVNTEASAEELISAAKEDNSFELKKYSSQYKEVKEKGEVVDTYYIVILTKEF